MLSGAACRPVEVAVHDAVEQEVRLAGQHDGFNRAGGQDLCVGLAHVCKVLNRPYLASFSNVSLCNGRVWEVSACLSSVTR